MTAEVYNNAAEVAQQLGLRRMGGQYRGPCPVCAGSDRATKFVLRQGDGGTLAWACHNGCSGSDIGRELHARGLLVLDRTAIRKAPPKPPKPTFRPIGKHTTDSQAYAMELWGKGERDVMAVYAHPYSQAKRIPPYRYGDAQVVPYRGATALMVPMFTLPGWDVCGVQIITGRRDDEGRWEKRSFGPRGIGRIGSSRHAPIYVTEGWADAVHLWEKLDDAVVVIAFGRVMPVAENLNLYFGRKRQITAVEDAE